MSNEAKSIVVFTGNAIRRVIGGGLALLNVFTSLIITPIMASYPPHDWPPMVARIDSWSLRACESGAGDLLQQISKILKAWIRGQVLLPARFRILAGVWLKPYLQNPPYLDPPRHKF